VRDRDEVGALAPAADDLVADSLVGELQVPLWLAERRVDDRVLDDDVCHAPLLSEAAAADGRRYFSSY
jgi:hypothetical protein